MGSIYGYNKWPGNPNLLFTSRIWRMIAKTAEKCGNCGTQPKVYKTSKGDIVLMCDREKQSCDSYIKADTYNEALKLWNDKMVPN